MSGKVVGWAMEQTTGSPSAKLILVKLADNANEDGYCWPSVALIMRHTELSERAVRGHLKGLADAGLITIEGRVTARGQATNGYQLNIPRQVTIRPPAPDAPAPCSSRRAGRQGMHRPPAPGAPLKEEPSKEPSLNLTLAGARSLTARAERLCQRLGKAKFDDWFGDAVFEDGEPPVIAVPSTFKQRWIKEKLWKDVHLVFGDAVIIECNTGMRGRQKSSGLRL